ncbi:MAG: hypothetical protein IJD78_00005 [Clostridia bacterium]|nr:hypothetical protein [Clostridia bacterium]
MKKIISVLLALALVFSTCAVAFAASVELDKDEISDYPLIIVPGYSSSSLVYPEKDKVVWGVNMDAVLERVLSDIVEIGVGLGALTVGNAKIIATTLAGGINDFMEEMKCNPDGTSKYPLERAVSTAEEVNNANLMITHPNGDHRQEQDMAAEFAEYIGHENIYNFTCDFRMGSEACAKQLDELIQDVKKHSGKDKVNLLAVSHGGQVTATYLTLYGWKNDVDNAVLTVPAIGGAGIAYDALTNNIRFDEECLIRFVEHGMRCEEDYNWLVKAQQLGFVDLIFEELIPQVFEVFCYWGSIWDFIPADKYEETKKLLDPVKSAALFEKTDRFHYEILPKVGEKLSECIENGMNISIISGTGNRIVTGLNENSDGIITTAASTGATCAPYGERFADGYVQKNPCGGKNKISPAMDVDASTAYLPDNTWFVNGLFHGMTYWDNYTRTLMMTTLFTDRITDVYSDANYPQFKDTTNPSSSVYAQFKDCGAGILGKTDKLVITNCNWENDIRISAVYCEDNSIRFKFNPFMKLEPGECLEAEVIGEIPELSGKSVGITVCYTSMSITPVGYRTQRFRIENGAAVENEGGFVSAETKTPLDDLIICEGIDNLLRDLGLKEYFAMFATIFRYWIEMIIG